MDDNIIGQLLKCNVSHALIAKGICEIMDIKGLKMYLAKCHQPPDRCLEGLSVIQIVWTMTQDITWGNKKA